MKIAILAPSHKSFINKFLPNYDKDSLPDGYFGAPFIGIIIEELLDRGHEIIAITTSVCTNADYTVRHFSYNRFKWIVVPSRKHAFRFNNYKLGRIVDFYAFERKLLQRETLLATPDFIHAHWMYEFAGALNKCHIPHLVTVHDNAYKVLKYIPNPYRFGRLIMSEWLFKNIKYLTTVSPYMFTYVAARCKNVKVIPNPVVVNRNLVDIQARINKKQQTLSEPIFIMIMNGWDARKNGRVGLLAFQNIKKKFPKATLHLFGRDTEINGAAYHESTSISLDGILFHGPIAHNDLLDHISKCHILLHPALEESFGVVLIEAMASGVPVIGGLNSGAVPWVINYDNLLVNMLDARSLEKKIYELLVINYYGQVALNIFKNTLNRFSAKIVIDQYENYYDEIMEQWP